MKKKGKKTTKKKSVSKKTKKAVKKRSKKKVKKSSKSKKTKKAVKKRSKKKVKKSSKSKKTATKKAAHRPPKYETDFPERAERYIARYKMDYKGLADSLGVAERTIFDWMKKKPKFKAAMERGKQLDAEALEHTGRKLASPHDEEMIIYEGVDSDDKKPKRLQQIKERRVKKNVVNVNALFKILAVDEPNRFGKRIAIEAGESITDIMAKVLSGGKNK